MIPSPLAGEARIAEVAITNVLMPFHEGEWHFALGSTSVKRGLLVRVTDTEGRTGYGYSGEIRHDGETLEVLDGASQMLATSLPTAYASELPRLLDVWDAQMYGNRRAKAGFELALWDLLGQVAGRPVHELLGVRVEGDQAVDVARIVSLDTPERMADTCAALVDEGYRFLKVKASGPLDLDVARLEAIRARVGNGPGLIIDANQSMTPKQAVAYCHATAHCGVDVFEQPVHREDIDGLRFVRERVMPLVEADEAAATVYDVMTLIRNNAIDAVSIKLPKMGGIYRSVELAKVCAAAGVQVRIGASFGSRLYAAANMQFLAVVPPGYACEVGEFEHLSDDPVSGLDVKDGRLALPTGPGLGVRCEPAADIEWRVLAVNGDNHA